MPFTNAYHGPGNREPADLAGRIDAELRARIEDAVDSACLDEMVTARRANGAAAPVADDPGDRDEYIARVRAFLERLRGEIAGGLADEPRRRLGDAIAAPPAGVLDAAIRVQVALAKEIPDYWQRFEAVRTRPVSEERPGFPGPLPSVGGARGAVSGPPARSGRERRGLLDRLLGRG